MSCLIHLVGRRLVSIWNLVKVGKVHVFQNVWTVILNGAFYFNYAILILILNFSDGKVGLTSCLKILSPTNYFGTTDRATHLTSAQLRN